MIRCPDSSLIQDFLEGELPDADARAFRLHIEACSRCASEAALYRRAFACLDRLPLADASPALTERILDRVVPARIRRRRWWTTVGWSYAGALAVCLLTVAVWLAQPGTPAWVTVSGEASRRLLHATVFTLDLLSLAVLSFANGWGILTTIGECLAPLGRALATILTDPIILAALGAATASCMGLLWWMRPRETRAGRGVRHVGVLGF